MISSLSSSAQSFLIGLDHIQQRAQHAQQELTTGLKINAVSDAPDQIASLLQTRSDLARTQQIDTNLTRVKTEVDTAEGALQGAVALVERAQTLGAQGASETSSASTRQNLADELGSILQQLVSTANTSVEGRYIFSGDGDQQAPYSIDLTQASPVSSYQGTVSTRLIQSADGSQFSVSITAQDIFDSPNAQQNVFSTISNLRQALVANDTAAVRSAQGDLQSSGAYLNQKLAFYGTVQDRVARAVNYVKNFETQLQAQLSGLQDADEAQAITELTQAQTAQQAALVSRAQLPKTTLFDYLG